MTDSKPTWDTWNPIMKFSLSLFQYMYIYNTYISIHIYLSIYTYTFWDTFIKKWLKACGLRADNIIFKNIAFC